MMLHMLSGSSSRKICFCKSALINSSICAAWDGFIFERIAAATSASMSLLSESDAVRGSMQLSACAAASGGRDSMMDARAAGGASTSIDDAFFTHQRHRGAEFRRRHHRRRTRRLLRVHALKHSRRHLASHVGQGIASILEVQLANDCHRGVDLLRRAWIQRGAKDERLFLYFVVFAFATLRVFSFSFFLFLLCFSRRGDCFRVVRVHEAERVIGGNHGHGVGFLGLVFNLAELFVGIVHAHDEGTSGDDFARERHRDVMVANFHPQEWTRKSSR